MDKKYILSAFGYAIVGLVLGIYMAASKDHTQLATHAHIMLLGFVVSFVYALCHKLWLNNDSSTLSKIQYNLHQIGTIGLVVGLFLLYSGKFPADALEPVLAGSSIIVLISLVIVKWMFIKCFKNS